MHSTPPPAVLLAATARAMSLGPVDLTIIVLYFAPVLGLGLCLRRYTRTGEDFFMAGREVTA